MPEDLKTPDARDSWVDRLPPAFRPYLRLMRADRPVGVWLLFLPCVWGTLVARPPMTPAPEMYRLWFLFLVGAFVMRSAGCIYNDIVDRRLDAKVARTASRPLVQGAVTIGEAWTLLVALSLVGLAVLVQFNLVAVAVGIGALALVAGYPFMKRITWWPQAWLGLTFNWGVLVGAAAVAGSVPVGAIFLYAAGLFWTLGYDTIYALQDIEDDALAGVRSSARRLGEGAPTGIAVFYGLTLVLAAFALISADALLGVLLLVPAGLHLAWQTRTVDIGAGETALRLFKSNVWAGVLLALPFLAA